MVVYVVVTSFLRNVAFLIYVLFGEISILEIPVVGNFFTFCRSAPPSSPAYQQYRAWGPRHSRPYSPGPRHTGAGGEETMTRG